MVENLEILDPDARTALASAAAPPEDRPLNVHETLQRRSGQTRNARQDDRRDEQTEKTTFHSSPSHSA